MKIIGINSSPRPEGNTAKLVEHFLSGARENGAETASFFLEGMKIHSCISCMVCKNNGDNCSIDDDMQSIYRAIQESSAIMFAFPVYMWQMNGTMKMLFDRLYAFLRRDFTNSLNGEKKVILGVTQGNPDSGAFRPYLTDTTALLNFLGYRVIDTLIATGTRDTADILRQSAILESAKQLGGQLAKS